MNKIKGVVAAGHEETAKAGKQILEAGGNAIDAAIAAAFAGCVAEPLLTGLGAGGYMLVHDTKTHKQTLFDFGVIMPGKNLSKEFASLTPTLVDFGETTQMFHGGHSSVGVPGFVAGLVAAHQKYGSVPLAELIYPAKKIATKGVSVTSQQAYLIKILINVISVTSASKELFVKNDEILKEGDSFYLPEICATLDEIAKTNGESFYKGALADLLVQEIQKGGGLITHDDLASYGVTERMPAVINYRGNKIYTNPPPSSGGSLIAHNLSLLSHFDLKSMGWHSPTHLLHLLETMIATNEVRKNMFDDHINDEDILEKLLASEDIKQHAGRIGSRLGNTTHLSIIDAQGNAVSMTTTNGSGSGVAVPGTGILLNNILGEEDLNPQGFHAYPAGHHMTSMMSPTIVMKDNKPRLAIGSAGSNRIRSAILQVISNILDFDMDVEEAISSSRIHTEGAGFQVELEKGIPKNVAVDFAKAGHHVSLWKEKNLFFGGVQAVAVDPKTGNLTGAGDPRRGGIAVTAR